MLSPTVFAELLCAASARARARAGRGRAGETPAREQADAHDHLLVVRRRRGQRRARLSRLSRIGAR